MLSNFKRIENILLFLILFSGILIGCTADVQSSKNVQDDLAVNQVLDQVQYDFQEQSDGSVSAEKLPGAVVDIIDQADLEATPMIMVDPNQSSATEASQASDPVIEGGGPIESAVVSSNGEVIPMQIEEGQISEETVSGSPPDSRLAIPSDSFTADPEAEVIGEPTGWEIFMNSEYGFSFQYPPSMVMVQPGGLDESNAQPLTEALIQDKHIVDAGLENLEPYRFAVRVFANQNQQVLAQWLTNNRPERSSETSESVGLTVGGSDAIQSCSLLDLAPNCAIYVLHDGHIFEIIPYGEFAPAILDTFRFIN